LEFIGAKMKVHWTINLVDELNKSHKSDKYIGNWTCGYNEFHDYWYIHYNFAPKKRSFLTHLGLPANDRSIYWCEKVGCAENKCIKIDNQYRDLAEIIESALHRLKFDDIIVELT
jgi:hypothetical protein